MARLDDICAINMGQSPDSASYNENGEGMPFFQGNADFGKIHPKVRVWCSAPTKIAYAGDVLISVRAPIGAMNIADRECCIGRGLAALTVNEGLCVKDYLWYAIASKVDELNSKGTGSTFKAISKGVLAETEIPLPDLNEQKKIAEQLAKVDGLIAERKEQLTKLDQLVKSRFIELFNEWKCEPAPLKTFLNDITYGFTNPMPDATEGPWKITAKDVVNRKVNYGTARKTTLEAFEELTAKSKPSVGDVLLTKDGTLGRCAVVETDGLCVNQSVAVLKCNERIVPKFLAILLQMPEYQKEMLKNAGGGTIKHIYITKVVDMLIAVPTQSQQLEFLSFVEQTDKSKLVIQQSLDKLEMLKKSLMQEYFG